MTEISFPFDSGEGSDSYEDRWRRIIRVASPSGVVGAPGSGAYDMTVVGLTATIKRRTDTGVAEGFVDGHMHRLTAADWLQAVTANANANPRMDRFVLRLDPVANTIRIVRLQGTPAASPAAPALTQVDNGVWETPLWSFTVPASSASPLTGLVDERAWIDLSGTTARVLAYGSSTSSQSVTGVNTRVPGGLNLTLTLTPGRLYEYQLVNAANNGSNKLLYQARAIAGSSSPTNATGTVVAASTAAASAETPLPADGAFTVATAGPYTFSPFVQATTSTTTFSALNSGTPIYAILRDAGPAASVVGSTPIAVP